MCAFSAHMSKCSWRRTHIRRLAFCIGKSVNLLYEDDKDALALCGGATAEI